MFGFTPCAVAPPVASVLFAKDLVMTRHEQGQGLWSTQSPCSSVERLFWNISVMGIAKGDAGCMYLSWLPCL
jgi:hypothetical protein